MWYSITRKREKERIKTMTKWNNEMRKTIDELMNTVCGGEWWETEMTEEMLNTCCERCPFAARCHNEGLCYGCSVWEESMGEDL